MDQSLPPNLPPELYLRPVARSEFKDNLRKKIIVATENTSENYPIVQKKIWTHLHVKLRAFALAAALIIVITLLSFQPAWSQIRERIRRFFMVTTTNNTTTTSTQFWSTMTQNELIPDLPYNPSISNSLLPQEQYRQPTINLYGYGYKNVYELDELVNINDKRAVFEGTEIK